jgi:transposase
MMGRQSADQAQFFYAFNLDERVPETHLLRRIDAFVRQALADVHSEMAAYYSHTGRPSIDPELLMRMLIVGDCYGIRSERKLCEEVSLNLAYRWFCRLDLDDAVPNHSSFSKNRHSRFRDSDLLRGVFERVVGVCLAAGLIKGDGFSVDASVIEADASRYHGLAPEKIDWSTVEKPSRAVREYLDALDEAEEDRKAPKVISPSDPASAWTAKANKRVQFGYGLNYLIDNEYAFIVDVEPTPARTFDEVRATAVMIERTQERFGLKPRPSRLTPPTERVSSLAGWRRKRLRRTFLSGTEARVRMGLSAEPTSSSIPQEISTLVRPAKRSSSTIAPLRRRARASRARGRCFTARANWTAMRANSRRAVARTPHLGRSREASTKRLAIRPASLRARRRSNGQETSGRRSRCYLRI